MRILLCMLRRHRVDRKHVRFDGDVYRGSCQGCRRKMIREVSGWIVADVLTGRAEVEDTARF